MQRQFKSPMYDEDPVTGKRILPSLQLDSTPGYVGSSTEKKMSPGRKRTLADLKPLRLTDCQEPQAKGKKTDSVRKGLYTKAQVNGSKSSGTSLVKKNSTSRDRLLAKTLKLPSIRIDKPSAQSTDIPEDSLSEFVTMEKICIDSCDEDAGSSPNKIDLILKSLEENLENEKIAFKNFREIHEQNVSNLKSLIALHKKSVAKTPKTDRKGLAVGELPGIRQLSKKVANQCLMLQDSPVHK